MSPSTILSTFPFYPKGRVSRLQELQMITQEGNNVAVYGMNGDFDMAQNAVKGVFADKAFGEQLGNANVVLSSANSINWGRLVPQIAYHFSAYADLVKQGIIKPGSKIDIAIPTGNFGNMLSAFYAKRMGLPIGKLICASNANNVLTEFLQDGVYDIRSRSLIQTHSPSMDILVASNIERLLSEITHDPLRVGLWMSQLKADGRFVVDGETASRLREEFYAGWVGNPESLDNLRHVADETGYVMDPHSSVAQSVAQEWLDVTQTPRPIIIDSTAHWAKFAGDVRDGLIGGRENLPLEVIIGGKRRRINPNDEFAAIRHVEGLFGVSAPRSIASLREKQVRHKTRFDATAADVQEAITLYLKGRSWDSLS